MQQADIVLLARNAGLSAENAVIASAVAMAESGGNERQITRDSDDESYGLWQINMLGAMGPSRRLLYGLKSNNDLLDPVVNAHVMSEISHQGNSWSAWGAYTNGSYKRFLPTTSSGKAKLLGKLLGGAADVAGDVKAAGGAVADVATSAGQAIDALQRVATWTSQPKNWVRVAYVVGGGVLVAAALVGLIASTKAGKTAISTGKKVVTKVGAGRAVAAAGPAFAIRARKAAETAAKASQRAAERQAAATTRAAAREAAKAAKPKPKAKATT